MLLQHTLSKTAQRLPDKTALKYRGRSFTYSEIDAITNQIAFDLKNKGVGQGDRVLICLENSPETVFYLYGVLKAGAIFVIIHPRTKPDKLKYIINDCTPKVLITTSDYFKSTKQKNKFKQSCPSLNSIILIKDGNTWGNSISPRPKANSRQPENIDLDLAGLIYTSGSSGFPRGVMMTHLNIISAMRSIIEYLHNSENDIIFNTLPLSFDYGLYQVFMVFYFGGTLILDNDFQYAQSVLKTIRDEKVTGLPLVPTMTGLLFKSNNLNNFDFSHLRYITNTGSTFPLWQIEKIRKLLPHVQIYSMYGLTECKRVSYLEPSEIDQRPQSVGKAMANLETMIVDDKHQSVNVGEIGELVVRGSTVMQGYWNDSEMTARRIKSGFYPGERLLFTGDLFKMDMEGYLYYIGRKDEMLKIKGERVYPIEIENIIMQFKGVQEVAIIGIEDELWGNTLKAYIIPDNYDHPPVKQQIFRCCRQKLELFAVPKEIIYVRILPRTSSGKVDKKMLSEVQV